MTTNTTNPISSSNPQPAIVNSPISSSSGSEAASSQFSELLSGMLMASSLTSSDSTSSSMSSLMAPLMMTLLQSMLGSQTEDSSSSTQALINSLLGSTGSSSLLGTGDSSSSLLNSLSGINAYSGISSAANIEPSKVLSSYSTTKYPITATGAFSQAAPADDYVPMYTSTGYGSSPEGLPVKGMLTQIFHPGHIGIDTGTPVGTPVHTTMDGKVIYAGWNNEGYGNLVIVENGKYKTYYAHLSSIPVTMGDVVKKGEVIGQSGTTGNSTGPHLHYETRVNNQAVDPAEFGGQPS
jgi:hypothetical protein